MSVVENTPLAWSGRAQRPSSWDAAGWSERSQTTRFRAVLSHLDLREGEALFDFGCGTGALADQLPATVDYVGWDWAHGMRDRARGDHPTREFPDVRPVCGFDHVVAIGCFNLPDNWSKEGTFDEIELLWRQTTRTLVVSVYRGTDDRCLVYTAGELQRCAERLSPYWLIDGSHLDNDLLLVVHR